MGSSPVSNTPSVLLVYRDGAGTHHLARDGSERTLCGFDVEWMFKRERPPLETRICQGCRACLGCPQSATSSRQVIGNSGGFLVRPDGLVAECWDMPYLSLSRAREFS